MTIDEAEHIIKALRKQIDIYRTRLGEDTMPPNYKIAAELLWGKPKSMTFPKLVVIKDPSREGQYIVYVSDYPQLTTTTSDISNAPELLARLFKSQVNWLIESGHVLRYEDPHEGLGE